MPYLILKKHNTPPVFANRYESDYFLGHAQISHGKKRQDK
jgi:hypothetical protein